MKIAIVGGGITGVTLAWLLSGLGKVVVYEKSHRLASKHGSIAENIIMSAVANNAKASDDAADPQATNTQSAEQQASAVQSSAAPESTSPEADHQTAQPFTAANITANIASVDKSPPLFFPHYQKDLAALFEYMGIYTEGLPLSYASNGRFPFKMNPMPATGLKLKDFSPLTNRRIAKDISSLYYSIARDYRQDNIPISLSLRQYMSGINLHTNSLSEAIYPVIGALWSYPPDAVQDLSASEYMKFVNESKLLEHKVKDQARYIPGGIDKYLRKLLFKSSFEYHLNNPVTKIKYSNSAINLTDSNKSRKAFDKIIITCAPQAAAEIMDPEMSDWYEALGKLTELSYPIYVHQDPAIIAAAQGNSMSSDINYDLNIQKIAYNYNLGLINQLPAGSPAMMSINSAKAPQNIIYQATMNRPALDVVSTRHYKELKEVQGAADVYYCTDGLDHGTSPLTGGISSALKFAKEFGITPPF